MSLQAASDRSNGWSFFHSPGEDGKSYAVAISTAAVVPFLPFSCISADASACWVWGWLFLVQQSQQRQFQFHALRHSCQQYHGAAQLPTDKKDHSLQITIVGFNTAFVPLANTGLVNESLKHRKTSRDCRNLGRNCSQEKAHTLSF